MRRAWSSIIGVIAVAAILIGVNMLADARLAGVQLDATQGRINSLSKGTRSILRGLKEPVTLRLYYSRALGARVPLYGSYADHVREMLEQYARVARGRLRLEFYNPEPFSDTEDRAMAYGLQGVPIDQAGQEVYFGLAGTNLLDDERTIGFFQPERERFLEYDLTRLVYELSNPKRPVVGVMSSLPLDGDPRMMMMTHGQGGGGPWVSMIQLRQAFTVRNVPLNVWSIDPDVQVLLVAQAQHLSDAAQYAIDQFVMRGGRLMVMVDPDSEAESAQPGPEGEPAADTRSDLKKLFDAWGIVYDPNEVVGDLTGAWRVRSNASDRIQAVDYVAWFNIRDGISRTDPATADLRQVTVASAGFLAKKPDAPIEFTPILSSSRQSGVIAADKVRTNPDPARILAGFQPQGGPRVIAARVRGVLKSAFTGPPAPAQGQQRPTDLPPFRAQTDGPANLVVVADTDILADRYWVRLGDFFGQQQATPFSDNGPFVANLVGTLAGGDALIGLRSRGDSIRPFTLVDDIQHRAEARFRRTEETLQTHLKDTEQQLQSLRQGEGQGAGQAAGEGAGQQGSAAAEAMLTPEQQSAIEAARREIVDTRQKLRSVQRDLNRDIDRLETELRLFDIVLVPAMLTLLAIGLGVARSRRRARAKPAKVLPAKPMEEPAEWRA
ncbi:MAG: Gldg family protein [Acidisphaera sp.]|nr:Gldg family protein [Acidisphaera sp.]